ncbi:MAG: redoxin domain-containing protein [Planctomycetales bacterium]|nr:redoxin domain-containing protein [Planctomycetales bacterium]
MAKLKAVWSDADQTNRRLQLALATGITANTELGAAITERNYQSEVLDRKDHSLWTIQMGPPFLAFNSPSGLVELDDFAAGEGWEEGRSGFETASKRNVVLIFYLGGEWLHCMEQARAANEEAKELQELDTVVVAVTKNDCETVKAYETDFDVTLLSDPDFSAFRAFRSFDDFEEIELHSAILIDKRGRIHWSQNGGEPFMYFDFLKAEMEKLNETAGTK